MKTAQIVTAGPCGVLTVWADGKGLAILDAYNNNCTLSTSLYF